MKWMPVFLLLSTSVLADDLAVSVFRLDPAKRTTCKAAVDEFLKANGIDPAAKEADAARTQVCTNHLDTLVLVAPPKAVVTKRILTLDVTGSRAAGNTNTGNIGGNLRYFDEFAVRHKLDVTFKGEYKLENDGSHYDSFELNGQYDFVLADHWSLLGYVSVGRDTKKELALVVNEIGGVAYNVFANSERHSLKMGVGVGHRHEELVDGSVPRNENAQGFSNDNLMLHYRARYEETLFKDTLWLIAGVWFQHILYSPGNSEKDARWFDVSDYRVISELQLRVQVAQFRGVKVTANFGGTYEFFAFPVTDVDHDLTLKGGVGISF